VLIRDAMSSEMATVGPEHTLREAAAIMMARNIGSAIVLDVDGEVPGIITERDILRSIAGGGDPDRERVGDHCTPDATVARDSSTLEAAARTMIGGGFRHVIVVDAAGERMGVLSIRDIVRAWLESTGLNQEAGPRSLR
jgi:CBS domain-containing protein